MKLTGVVHQLRKERDRAQMELSRLDTALAALGGLDGTGGASRRTGRSFSVASRARMAATQRARWAKAKGFAVVGGRSKRRTMSAAARRKIALAKRRWWANKKAKQKG